jgi:hypothetical protein
MQKIPVAALLVCQMCGCAVYELVAPLVSFGSLPLLRQGTDVCDNLDGTQPLDGTITQLCVSH